jgi:hypothetical protein
MVGWVRWKGEMQSSQVGVQTSKAIVQCAVNYQKPFFSFVCVHAGRQRV